MRRIFHLKYLFPLIVILLILSSGKLLTLAGRALICEGSPQFTDTITITLDQRRGDAAAFATEAVADGGVQRVLLLEDRFRWTVEVGAMISQHEMTHNQLIAGGVQPGQIEILPGATTNYWDRAARLVTWLDDYSDASVLLLCDRFESQNARFVLDQVLPASASARVRVVGLADRRFDETNWWKSRIGVKSFVGAMLRAIHSRLIGQPDLGSGNTWDPVEYERKLAQQLSAAL